MKRRLLDFLSCPECGHRALQLTAYRPAGAGEEADVLEGALHCAGCGTGFPIIAGVPRMLPSALRGCLLDRHAEFFRAHPELKPPSAPSAPRDMIDTFEGFSHQHVRLNERSPETERWQRTFLSSIPVEPSFFEGKIGLEVGCGYGRHLYWANSFGAETIGVDLSESVEVAAENVAGLGRGHVVQGDVFHLPFPESTFDFAYSIGVLHHTPDPRQAFLSVVSSIKPRGEVFAWVYGLQGMRWWYRLSHMKHVRAVTTRLPRALQSALSWALAVLLEIVLWTPCRLLERLPRGAALVERIPLGDACRRPMRAKMRSVFDRINPPLTYYHTAEELHEWLAAGGITGGAVRNRDGRGWMISGTRGE